jgi:hypothetical protein
MRVLQMNGFPPDHARRLTRARSRPDADGLDLLHFSNALSPRGPPSPVKAGLNLTENPAVFYPDRRT